MNSEQFTRRAFAILAIVLLWLVVCFYAAGVYLDCIAGSAEYPCLRADEQAFRVAIAIVVGITLTIVAWRTSGRP